MSAIGGYFGLELNDRGEYHRDGIRLNTGRNALEFLLLTRKIKKIYIPYFTCDAVLEPIERNNIAWEFYHINEEFEALFDFDSLEKAAFFLYTNYFGLKDSYISKLEKLTERLIIDNSLSFFSRPLPGVPTFYTARKFFGVPDGAYLFSEEDRELELDQDHSFMRCEHLLKRIDVSAEEGFTAYQSNEEALSDYPIRYMSALTQRILASLDYESIASARRENFLRVHQALKLSNKLNLELSEDSVPMFYPYWQEDPELRARLTAKRIYTPVLWPNVLDWCSADTLEYSFAKEILYLPIDQRYSVKEMNYILNSLIS